MSAVKVIRALLLADPATLAIVPASNIMAGVLPQKTVIPAIALTEISRVDRAVLKAGAYSHCTSRVQVTVFAKTYSLQKQLITAVRRACRDRIGVLDSTAVDTYWEWCFHKDITGVSVLLDGTGPDFNDSDTGFYMQTQDFMVGYTEPT